ncbi:MAG: DUF711 family protein [Christensenellaceae bacterium]
MGGHGTTAALALLNDAVKKGRHASPAWAGFRARLFPFPRISA